MILFARDCVYMLDIDKFIQVHEIPNENGEREKKKENTKRKKRKKIYRKMVKQLDNYKFSIYYKKKIRNNNETTQKRRSQLRKMVVLVELKLKN